MEQKAEKETMTAKSYLMQVRKARVKIEQMKRELTELRAASGIPVQPDGERVLSSPAQGGCADIAVRIVQLGDSHVRGHVFSVAARHTLEAAWGGQAVYPDEINYRTTAIARETGAPGLVYHAIGQNGATASDFCTREKMEQMAALRPDLIILSFGTNESHNRRYDPVEHFAQLDALLTLLRHYAPDATVMLTTPPGSYVRASRRRRIVNPRTVKVVDTLLAFAERRGLPVWDLYNLAGGSRNACTNWKNNRLMQRDQVHYTHQGYTIQGNLLGEVLLKAFNDYVAN